MPGKLRIAFLIDTIDSDKGGTEKQILNIIRRIDSNKFKMTVVCLYESAWIRTNLLPCEVISLGYKGFLKVSFPLVLTHYLRLLRDRQFDVVQTFFEDSMFVGFLGKIFGFSRHALVISRRDLGLGLDEPAYHKLYKKVKPFILKSVDGIAANAHAIKNYIVRYENIPSEKISVICNGLDIPPAPGETPSLFMEHKADLWVGIVANLKPVKRIDLLLHALAKLKESAPQKMVRVVVLGDDHLRAELENMSKTLGVGDRVHFLGSVENVGDYLGHIDVGVLCSDKERSEEHTSELQSP
jgi:glycosyltransferase involved in cell wall biosynthesis